MTQLDGQGALWEIDRAARLDDLIAESNEIIDRALAFASEWDVRGVIGLFSGGNDSTVLAHLIRDRVTAYGHANTQAGAEPTRQFVRDTCARWDIPLLERTGSEQASGYSYEDLILRRCPSVSPRAKYDYIWPGGFPGPYGHRTFFGHLKERALNLIRRDLIDSPRSQRIVFMDGRRAEESASRSRFARTRKDQPWSMNGTEINVSPLLRWTKLDLNEYRRRFPDLPRNEVADLMHMSMECACGCYSRDGEMGEMETWLPGLAEWLHGLEWQLQKLGLDINPKTLTWGAGNQGGRCRSGMCNT
jgi:3'-phosphoadenosine 5'-phosphosulfate sulfotransferase (PAPS reductase)/FAD synthetase